MPPSERTLYQFPISHYCEKTRWNLDAKGLPYVIRNLMPGYHRVVTKRLTRGGRGTVPVLEDGGQVVSDSTDIALHLERAHPAAPTLIPASGADRERVLALEAYFDDIGGKSVRSWVYAQLFAGGVDIIPMVFGAFPLPVRLLGRVMSPLVKMNIRRQYVQSPEKVEAARVKMLEGLDRLEQEIQGDAGRYLVGDALSIADIAAAALYAPLLGPPESPYAPRPDETLPPVLAQMRAAARARPAGQWMLRRYQEDRQRRARGFGTASA